ncbi:MAG TPA: radical SAM protein [Anaerolineae bacterium]|nr:radical SAM protein [Anaerolineae bacterium]
MSDDLLVLPFATQHHQYIYDVVTNRIFYAPEPIAQVLQRYRRQMCEEIEAALAPGYSSEAVRTSYARVRCWAEEEGAFFFDPPDAAPEMNEKAYWDSLLRERGIDQLFLVITDNCNLRCRYCIYSGQYGSYRQLGPAVMSFETARMAIDYYYQLHQRIYLPNRLLYINFYGGEPLLRFDFIKQCVAYARSIEDEHVRFSFHLTTNGTLLKDTHVDFFREHQFTLVFSLDGPRQEHDRNRVFPNGLGSYDRVMHALELIRAKDPDYFREHVMLNTVFDQQTDLLALNRFFIEYKDQLPGFGFVNIQRHGSSQAADNADVQERRLHQQTELLRQYRLAKTGREIYDVTFCQRLLLSLQLIADRDYTPLGQLRQYAYTGRCLPGSKIAVRPDGTLHMCERINERFPIGTVKTGLDFERIRDIVSRYDREVTRNCPRCVAQRFCPVCYAQACTGNGFDAGVLCRATPDFFKAQLSYLCSILEENPDAFNELRVKPRIVKLMQECG